MRRKWLISCGLISSLLYIAMNIFVPIGFKGYDSASQTVSELSAIGAPTRALWVALGTGYTLLMLGFGWGALQSSSGDRKLKTTAALIFIYSAISLFWPLAPMHDRLTLAHGGRSATDEIHLILAMVTVVLMTLAIAYGAASFGRRFRYYSYLTIIILLVFGALTGLDAPKVEANLPTPWVGVWERINIGVFLVWIMVLSLKLLFDKRRIIPD
ncbi:MAG: DUF998 domain-containing protein [Bacteroidota bacterium]|nr:DUF998 domain-containing protein [Bacteroidota bacterium]